MYIYLKFWCVSWSNPYSIQRQAEHFLDVKVKQGKDNDGYDSPSSWLCLMGLECWRPMPCLDLDFDISYFGFIYICLFKYLV